MASSSSSSSTHGTVDPRHSARTLGFLEAIGISDSSVDDFTSPDDYSLILSRCLKPKSVQRGNVCCILSVQPPMANYYKGLHGGVVAAVAERVSIACARTVVAADKELFLSELSISYLSYAPSNAELRVQASLMRSGRSITVVSVEFKHNGKLTFFARSTFYTTPRPKL